MLTVVLIVSGVAIMRQRRALKVQQSLLEEVLEINHNLGQHAIFLQTSQQSYLKKLGITSKSIH
jgi:N-acetylglutamate synthase-like GNAT family acetyltransferase